MLQCCRFARTGWLTTLDGYRETCVARACKTSGVETNITKDQLGIEAVHTLRGRCCRPLGRCMRPRPALEQGFLAHDDNASSA